MSVPDFIQRAMDDAPPVPPPEGQLAQVRAKARQLRDAYQRLASLQDATAAVEAEINLIESKELLDIMVEAKMPSFALEAEGNNPPAEFKRDRIVSASIPKEREGEAWAWLEESGHAELIKHEFKIAFGMGDYARAKKLEASLKKGNWQYDRKVSVHASSLTAFVKRQLEANNVVPNDLLGVYTGEKVSVTLGGEKIKKRKK